MMKDSETSAALPGFADVRMLKPSLLGIGPYGLGVSMLVGGSAGMVGRIWNLPLGLIVIVLVPFAILLGKAANKLDGRGTKRAVGQILEKDDDPQANLRAAAKLGGLVFTKLAPISVMTRAMGKIGRIGETYQLWWKAEPDSVEPLTMVFEPRLLDEADVGFEELAQATASKTGASDANSSEAPGWREDMLEMRGVQRNIRLKGGWPLLSIVAVLVLFALLDALRSHAVTWLLLVAIGSCFALFFIPARSRWFATSHWLLVPGGILHRKAKTRDRKVTLHLFVRRHSVMTIYQQRNRGVWLLTVADAEASETTVVTDRERQLLLRAWLSPVEPPPLERLVDLS